MPSKKNAGRRCPACSGEVDRFGSCRRCGRAEPAPAGPGPKPPRKGGAPPEPAPAGKYAAWQISDRDDDTEIVRKRSLMRLDSRRTYEAMGSSVRAHEAQKASLLWLVRLFDVSDEAEKEALGRMIRQAKAAFEQLGEVRRDRIAAAAGMEKAMEAAHAQARRARLKQADKARADARRAAAKAIAPGEDTEGYSNPEPAALPPEDLLERAREALGGLDGEKRARRGRPAE